jgi:hypothetical protein
LKTVRNGDTILLVHTPGMPFPLNVTEPYLAERSRWAIMPCQNCGADQTLDPMTVMARTRFPAAPDGEVVEMFTSFCGCGGMMVLSMVREAAPQGNGDADQSQAMKKPWWKFW